MESNVSSLLEIAPLSEIQTLICHFAEFNHLYYPVVDLPEMMAFLRNLRHHDSIPVGSAALIAAMCYQAASSLSCSSEQDPRSGPWSIQSSAWKALSHQLLFASRYPLRPNLNTVRAAILLAVSSIAEWAPDPDPTPIAVLVRAGQALGLHRDPEWFQCSAREADFRRRIWWSIHGIDLTYSMAHGVPPLIHSRGYDVKTQTGHDHDHDGDCKSLSGSEFEALEARKPGNTIDLHLMWSRIVETIYSTQKPTKEIFEKLEAEMTECCAAILDKSDSRRPLREPSPRDEFIAACERMCCHRSVLILHQPYLRSRLWPQTSRAKTLEACKGYIREYTATLTKPTLSAYRWILRHYSVFHMCAIILQDLFQTPHSNESAELLELIERTFAQFSTYPDTDPKWKKLEALRVKAWVANGWVPAAENKKPDNVDAGGGGLDLALGLDLGLDSNASLLEPEWEWDWDPLLASFVWDDSSKQAA
ncbi:hypothetical protein A1O3_02133 [Capronia epimyces CBS 606.96]|uniref:Xylanolytic transcriptional activator regulatory domain-containing protein n=1 Tax=Capronia epimyces CBS 606.96 TaxID=1182542 RepID=W9Z3J1_9EURO|nr:uncharacterized protein A1O3_02133 [Capronia epimyces CBS 606.96]EXJ89069.1 hypothetical protein A1O3_02133 [Capronia epimyces CBS 606.96]